MSIITFNCKYREIWITASVDIGFKDGRRQKWIHWGEESRKENVDCLSLPRDQVLEWIDFPFTEISRETIRNSWLKGGMRYFPLVE